MLRLSRKIKYKITNRKKDKAFNLQHIDGSNSAVQSLSCWRVWGKRTKWENNLINVSNYTHRSEKNKSFMCAIIFQFSNTLLNLLLFYYFFSFRRLFVSKRSVESISFLSMLVKYVFITIIDVLLGVSKFLIIWCVKLFMIFFVFCIFIVFKFILPTEKIWIY